MPRDKLTEKIKTAQTKRDAMQKIEDKLADSSIGKAERKKLSARFNALRDMRDGIILSIDNRLRKTDNSGVFFSDFARFHARVMGTHLMARKNSVLAGIADMQQKMGIKNASVDSLKKEFDIALTRAEMKAFLAKGSESLSWEIKRAAQRAQERKEEEARERKRVSSPGKPVRQRQEEDPLDIISRHFERRVGGDSDQPMDRNHAAEKALYQRLYPWDEYPVSEDEKIKRDTEIERLLYGNRDLRPD